MLNCFLSICVLLLGSAAVCFAQDPAPVERPYEPRAPQTDLLTLNGGKPNLSATGEGITAYKTDEIYQRGKMSVQLVKPADTPYKIELPTGYTVFNDLMYAVQTNAVFTGTCDIVFKLPSANAKEIFAQLRILTPAHDYADPTVPRWTDITLDSNLDDAKRWLPELEIKQRLRDFKARTLHAVTDDAPLFFIVALRDPAKVRDQFNADLEITGTGTPQVTEGRSVTYELKVTNRGPDTATGIALHAPPSFSFVSVNASQGQCKMSAQNVYCKFPSLEKGRSIDVTIVERCAWTAHIPPSSSDDGPPSGLMHKTVQIRSEEQDPSPDNNHLDLITEIFPDQNKGPVIEVLAPTFQQNYPGPTASVPILFKASDPDGFIRKIELFDREEGKLLGQPTLRPDGDYELIYKEVGFGRHWVEIVATDNLGRFVSETAPEFFVNGTAKVEIISPKAGTTYNSPDGGVTVTIRATSSSPLKKVSLDTWDATATSMGNDTYVAKLKACGRKCEVRASAFDEKGIETRSEPVEFILASPPDVRIAWRDEDYVREFEAGKPLKVNNEVVLVAAASYEDTDYDPDIIKVEIFVDGRLVCTNDQPTQIGYGSNCVWRPSPGKHRLQAVVTDRDGAVGKSEVIEVMIERP